MTTELDLSEYLLTRFDEAEAAARRAPDDDDEPWTLDPRYDPYDERWVLRASATYVLADIAAKRRVVAHAAEASVDRELTIDDRSVTRDEVEQRRATDPGQLILVALVQPYSARPDFNPSWVS